MPASYREQTAVSLVGDDTYEGNIPEGWDIGSVVNGGFALSYAVRAMIDAVDKPDPLSVNAHFERPAMPGPVTIRVERGREGRTLSTVSAVMEQNGKEIIRAMSTLGDFDKLEGPELILSDQPEMAAREECFRTMGEPEGGSFYPPAFVSRFDIRHDPRFVGFAKGEPAGEPKMGGWLGLLDDEPLDAVALTLFADAYPPTIFNTTLPVGWAPTVELTIHFRQRPISPALVATYGSKFIFGGMFSGDVELWDPERGLIVEARQIALLPKMN